MSDIIVEVCSIQSIEKHPNADRLSIVKVKGWQCIVGLDQYKVGDKVVYIPPDCIVPESLVEKYKLEYLGKDRRIKTQKLRGYMSYGLILELPDDKDYKIGQDMSEIMGITKWEPPAPSYQQVNSNQQKPKKSWKLKNPDFKVYTKAPNIKHYQTIFQEGEDVVITEKLHGTNARYMMDEYRPVSKLHTLYNKFMTLFGLGKTQMFYYGSHRVQITGNSRYNGYYGDDVYGQIAKKYKMAEWLPKGYTIYGEIVGPKIQDLTYGLKEIDLYVFDIMKDGEYLPFTDYFAFCIRYDLKNVPILYYGKYRQGIIEELTDGYSVICGHQIREGCVIKSSKEELDPRIGRKMLKSISEQYLLRESGTEYH